MNYWLFADECHYATGGVCSLCGRFATEADAVARPETLIAADKTIDWYQIVDVLSGRVVRHHNGGGYGTDGKINCPFVELAPEDDGAAVLIRY